MRAQSHVIGVALMAGIAVIALGALTVGIGSVVDSQTSNADANRVADGIENAVQGVEQTGPHSQQITFAEGRLETVERTLRVLRNGTVIEEVAVDGLVFESGDRRVAAVAGAVVRGTEDNAWMVADPPITSSERNEVVVVGAPILNASHVSTAGRGGITTTLRTDVSHTEQDLGTGEYSVAIETVTPSPFERYFESQGASIDREQFRGDNFESIVATYPDIREGYLVRHYLDLELGR